MAALANLVLSVLVMMVIDSTLTTLRVSADMDLSSILDAFDLDDPAQQSIFLSSYKNNFRKNYKNLGEQQAREANVIKNTKKIQKFNKANRKGGVQLKVNHLSDNTDDELADRIKPLPPRNSDSENADDDTTGQKRRKRFFFAPAPKTTTAIPTTPLPPPPASKNWTALGHVTPVKNQGNCGSCWAFAATGALEAALVRSGRPLQNVSMEHYVDCLTYQGGCGGGWDTNAYNLIISNKTMATEENYPYTMAAYRSNTTIPSCKINSVPNFKVNLTKKLLPTWDDATVVKVVGNIGPVSATLNISMTAAKSFFYYGSGIINASDPNFCGNVINHMVVITGYGTDPVSGIPYYLVKNSWGTWWGEYGYCRISRNIPAPCGLSIFATLPTIAP